MKILYVGSEAVPFAATGGLGDVMGSLPRAVKDELTEGDVRVIMPLYPSVREKFSDRFTLLHEGEVSLAWRRLYCGILTIMEHGVPYYFIDNEYYFKRESCYGNFDDGERFAFFSAAVLWAIKVLDFFPDVIHANDWQSALVPVYLRLWYGERALYDKIKTVYTIHNIDYQGIFSPEILWDVFGIWDGDRWMTEYRGAVNLTKGAIVAADAVTTVSPTYSRQIMTPHFSSGLHHILKEHEGKVTGIVNGIDTERYDPETDPALAENYSADDPSGKAECRLALCRLCSFPEDDTDTPIIGMVSRLASHKGFDLVVRVISEMIDAGDARFVLLGTGEGRFEDYFRWLEWAREGRFKAHITFNSDLASKIYSGSDMFLMPSASEPCGLSQMIAARYGAVPIVRETGGLADTIRSVDDDGRNGCGFSFTNYNAHDMMYTVRRAAWMFRDSEKWSRIRHSAMTKDFSWQKSATEYISLYRSLTGK